MRAVQLEEFGEPNSVLNVQDVSPGKPSTGEVRVKMLASPVNPSDLMMIRGQYGILPALPATPGFEGVGIVQESGGGLLGSFLKGKRVAVLNRQNGNWADETIVPAKQAIPLAKDLTLDQATMFFVNPATAYIMTQHVLEVGKGEWLLQTAAASALGKMIIRLGKHLGFRTLNVVRRESQIDELKQLGADEVLVFDAESDPQQFRESVLKITGRNGVSYAVDPVGGATASAVVDCLGNSGRVLLYGTLSNEPISFSPRSIMTPGATIEGFWLANYMNGQNLVSKLRLVNRITSLIKQGILTAEVSQKFPLEEIAAAVTAAEEPGRSGKVLLSISEP